MFKGIFTALITPFNQDGSFDKAAYQDFINWQISQGIDGVVPCGTTGESPTLSHDEHNLVIEACCEAAKGKAQVIAGTGSNSTSEAIALTKYAKAVGADAALIVVPYYNKPTQEGIYQHFKAINDAVAIPIIIYNVPARTITDISDITIARLSKLENIVGVKDATADLSRPANLSLLLGGADFCQLSGEDVTALPFNVHGGVGCISVTANIAPKLCGDLQRASLSGDIKQAQVINAQLMPLHNAIFAETNPIGIKYASSYLDLSNGVVRLPLTPALPSTQDRIKRSIDVLGLRG